MLLVEFCLTSAKRLISFKCLPGNCANSDQFHKDFEARDLGIDQGTANAGRATKMLEIGLGCAMNYGPGASALLLLCSGASCSPIQSSGRQTSISCASRSIKSRCCSRESTRSLATKRILRISNGGSRCLEVTSMPSSTTDRISTQIS
jgi:hypothetical protein